MFERGAGWDEGKELSIVLGCEDIRRGRKGGDGCRGTVWLSWKPCCFLVRMARHDSGALEGKEPVVANRDTACWA